VGNNPVNLIDPTGLQKKDPDHAAYHPPEGIHAKCTPADDCSAIKGKMLLLERMIDSHTGMDLHSGANRHAVEIPQLWTQYAKCQEFYVKKCSSKDSPPKMPVLDKFKAPDKSPAPESNSSAKTAVAVGAGAVATVGTGYLIYRGARLLLSCTPWTWWTFGANLATP
jgi:hypothetical protein